MWGQKSTSLPSRDTALPGRQQAMPVTNRHYANGHPIQPPFPQGMHQAVFGMGCFWGVERLFWQQHGVYTTAVGYAGGYTPNPSYQEVCSGQTGHTEAVLVVYDPAVISYGELLKLFWESHDPTQGMRQGNDRGTQYRSAIYCVEATQLAEAQASQQAYSEALAEAKQAGPITTEIALLDHFYYAEDHHQQYLAKNPHGYCNLGGIGVPLPTNTKPSDHLEA